MDDDSEHNSSPDTSDEFDPEFSCEVCDKSFSGIKPLLQHEKGARHRRALRRRRAAKDLEEGGASQPLPDDSPAPFAECRPCGKVFSGPESHHQHLKGKGHRRRLNGPRLLEKVKKEGALRKEAELQLAGTRLLEVKKEAFPRGAELQLSGAVGPSSPDHSGEEEEDIHTKVFQCEECSKAFTGVEPFFQHLLSKAHRRTLKQKGLLEDMVADSEDIDLEEDVLTCRICRMSFSGPESAEAHIKGRGHLKKLEQVEWKRKKRAGRHKMRAGDVSLQEDIGIPGDAKLSTEDAASPPEVPEDAREGVLGARVLPPAPQGEGPQEEAERGPPLGEGPEGGGVPCRGGATLRDPPHGEDVVPKELSQPESAECLDDTNPQKFIDQPEDVDETVPLDGSRLAEDTTESLQEESSVWV